MYKIYRTTKDTIIAEEKEEADLTAKFMIGLDCKEYLMLKSKDKVNLYNFYNFSLVGQVTEIADEIPFEEFRDLNYANLKKEAIEEELKSKKKDYPRFDWKYFAEHGTTGR